MTSSLRWTVIPMLLVGAIAAGATQATAATLPVCARDRDTGGETLCATVRPPNAWAKAAAYRATGYALPRPRTPSVLAPLALRSITVTKPNRVDEGECGTQAIVEARYAGGGKALTYSYTETDCGGLRGGTPVRVPRATVAIAQREGPRQVVEWTRSPRADLDNGYMVGQMMLSSSTLSRDRLLAIAASIR